MGEITDFLNGKLKPMPTEEPIPSGEGEITAFLKNAPPRDKGIGGVAKDLAIDLFGVGGNQLAGTAIGLGDMMTHGRVGKAIEDSIGYRSKDAVDYWNKQKTEQSQQQAQELGEQKGFVDTANYSDLN